MDTNSLTEMNLLERARRLEGQALAEIYDLHSPGIFRYAYRLLGDSMLAEDCVGETFSRFLKALQAGRGPGDYLQAYLYRVAHNFIVDQYRRQPIAEELDESHSIQADPPEEDMEARIRRQRLRKMIGRLTPDQQKVIALKYFEECSNEEIARVLEKPVGAIKSLQHRALASLQRLLEEDETI